jgi:hypothetical protein
VAGEQDHERDDETFRTEVRDALGELRGAIEELRSSPPGQPQREARRDVADAEDELEQTLRKHGYRLSRADLDSVVDERSYDRFKTFMERLEREKTPPPPPPEPKPDDDQGGDDDRQRRDKPPGA